MKIVVVGTGYVGLVTGTCFAETGNDVYCVDIDKEKVQKLQSGINPIYEPGLEDLLKRNIREKRLHFTTSLKDVLSEAAVVFIAVGTPTANDGSADLTFIKQVAQDIGCCIDGYKVIVNKSTVPVGTGGMVTEIIQQEITKRGLDIKFSVVSNPEFLKEGAAIQDFMNPDRVVLGSNEQSASDVMVELYSPFVGNENPVLIMDRTSAELTKYAANGFLATKISFMNEIANLAEKTGADVNMVRKGIGLDSRIGKQFLYPGPGYGGSCFPKDVKALIRTGQEHNYEMKILNAVEAVNKNQKQIIYRKLKQALGDLAGKRIAIWGLAFKAKTDDMRESAAIDLIEALLADQAIVAAYDPEAMENTKVIFSDKIEYHNEPMDVLKGADALAIVTEWAAFQHPEFGKMKALLKQAIIVDSRNLYALDTMKKNGFNYFSVGRKDIIN